MRTFYLVKGRVGKSPQITWAVAKRSTEFIRRLALPTKHTCPTCGLVCKSAGGLTRRFKIHKDVPQPKILNVTSANLYMQD